MLGAAVFVTSEYSHSHWRCSRQARSSVLNGLVGVILGRRVPLAHRYRHVASISGCCTTAGGSRTIGINACIVTLARTRGGVPLSPAPPDAGAPASFAVRSVS